MKTLTKTHPMQEIYTRKKLASQHRTKRYERLLEISEAIDFWYAAIDRLNESSEGNRLLAMFNQRSIAKYKRIIRILEIKISRINHY